MRILAIERDVTACNYYRVYLPMVKLREHGLADTVLLKEEELGTDYAVQRLLEADIVLFQRPANEDWFNFIKLCRKNGKIIVVDYDDHPFETSPLNPYYRFVGIREYVYKWPSGQVDNLWVDGVDGFDIERNIMRRDMFQANFKKADLVTTTTPVLQETLKEMNPNTAVLPNFIDLDPYARPEFVKREIRIGWQGGVSHYEDLYLIRPVLEQICKKYENVKFIYSGDYRFVKLFQKIPTRQFEFHPWVPHSAYPYKSSLLNLDIGICPLVDNEFNRNKSAIKWMEYSAIGAATIASNIPPYAPVLKDGETGLLVKDDEWEKAIDLLINDKDLRQKLAKNALEDVSENHNIDKKVHVWHEEYTKLIKQEVAA